MTTCQLVPYLFLIKLTPLVTKARELTGSGTSSSHSVAHTPGALCSCYRTQLPAHVS